MVERSLKIDTGVRRNEKAESCEQGEGRERAWSRGQDERADRYRQEENSYRGDKGNSTESRILLQINSSRDFPVEMLSLEIHLGDREAIEF